MDIYGDMNPGDLNDTLVGTDDPDTIFGGQGDDSIDGAGGADSLDGGIGNDTLVAGLYDGDTLNGGAGDDTYYVDGGATAVIVEAVGGGTDTVVTHNAGGNLNDYANVENLTLAGPTSGEFGYVEGDGNSLDNLITSTSANVQYSDLYGYDGNDTLVAGGSLGAYLDGGSGNDSLTVLVGNASLYGGNDADTLDASAATGPVTLDGGDGADSLIGSAAADDITGGAGADTMTGGDGADVFHLAYDGAVDEITDFQAAPFGVDATRDVLDISSLLYSFSNYIYGDNPFTEANPHLQFVQEGADTVLQIRLDGTGAWQDFVKLDGVTASDLISNNLSPNFSPFGSESASAGGDDGDNYLQGSALPDALYGYGGNDTLDGGFEADSLYGGDGNDVISDSFGENQIYGGADNDIVYGLGSDLHDQTVYGGAGSDTFAFDGAGAGHVLIADFEAGPGGDVLDLQSVIYSLQDYDGGNPFVEGRLVFTTDGADSVLSADIFGNGTLTEVTRLANVDWHALTADNFTPGYSIDGHGGSFVGTPDPDTYYGGVNDDTITGAANSDSLYGGDGNDSVDGGVGDDFVYGGAGADTVYGGDDNDVVDGGAGADTLYGGTGNDSLYGEGGSDVVYGGGGDDYFRTLTGQGPDTIYGGAGTDLLTLERTDAAGPLHVDLTLSGLQSVGDGTQFSSIEQIRFAGGLGADFAQGGDLDDVLKGMAGDDTLIGGSGNDILQGGAGHDSLTGGLGGDTFRFDGPTAGSDDVVTDFTSGTDHVALSKTGFGITSVADFDIVTAAGGPTEAKATLIVDTAAHTLSWDADGTGAGAATLLAHGAFTTNAGDYLVF